MFIKKTIQKSILAGILIGFGVIINLQSESKVIGSLLFSFGLVTIIAMQLNLYTGKIGFFNSLKDIPFLLSILCFNFSGIGTTIILYVLANQNFGDVIAAAAAIKFSKSALTLFINALFCGMLIHFAVVNKNIIITIFAVMIFILIGAEHCIADFPYFIFYNNCNITIFLKFICVILGNSVGAIIIERLLK